MHRRVVLAERHRLLVGRLVGQIEVVVNERNVRHGLDAEVVKQLEGVKLSGGCLGASLSAVASLVVVGLLGDGLADEHKAVLVFGLHRKRTRSPRGMGGSDNKVSDLNFLAAAVDKVIVRHFLHRIQCVRLIERVVLSICMQEVVGGDVIIFKMDNVVKFHLSGRMI